MLRLSLAFWRQSLRRSGKRILKLIFPRWWCCLCLRRDDEHFCRSKRNTTRRKAAKMLLLPRRREVGRTKLGAFNTLLRERARKKWRHLVLHLVLQQRMISTSATVCTARYHPRHSRPTLVGIHPSLSRAWERVREWESERVSKHTYSQRDEILSAFLKVRSMMSQNDGKGRAV